MLHRLKAYLSAPESKASRTAQVLADRKSTRLNSSHT